MHRRSHACKSGLASDQVTSIFWRSSRTNICSSNKCSLKLELQSALIAHL